MNVLVLGWSRIVARRVFAAFCGLDGVDQIDIASRRPSEATAATRSAAHGKVFGDYVEALAQSPAELVYVSTVNAKHARWVEAALESGRHVIVDKPAFVDLASAERLVALSERRRAALVEATVYAHHPQFSLLSDAFANGPGPDRLTATFSFPSLDSDDFRYRAEAAGGALYDLGPYAVSPGRILFGSAPEEVVCRITARDREVETAFSVLLRYPEGRVFLGHFGFGTPYLNRLEALGPAAHVTLERAFTSPADAPTTVRVKRLDGEETFEAPPTDAFLTFLRSTLQSIERQDLVASRRALLADAHALNQLRHSAGVT